MKRRLWLFIALILVISIFLIGCAETKKDTVKTPAQQSTPSNTPNADNSTKPAPDNSNNSSPASNSKLSFFFANFQLAVPGVAYVQENSASNTATLHTSSGVQSGGIKINSDGTYIWNSTWDGKVINGKWKETGDNEYPVLIMKGEEGKDWKLAKSTQSGSDIVLWDGNYMWKNGKK